MSVEIRNLLREERRTLLDIGLSYLRVFYSESIGQYIVKDDKRIRVSTLDTFWTNLYFGKVAAPYCRRRCINFWLNCRYLYNQTVLGFDNVYRVDSLIEDNLVFLGRYPVLYKKVGSFHSGIILFENKEPRIVSPLVIGIEEGKKTPLFDYRRFDREMPNILSGIALTGQSIPELSFNRSLGMRLKRLLIG